MAPWHVDFHIVPTAALGRAAGAPTRDVLATTQWWHGTRAPVDLHAQLDAVAPGRAAAGPDIERWGSEQGNHVDVRSADGEVRTIVARVDVRRLDARFAAALLGFVRSAGATLVRRDGSVVGPTIGAFAAALRGSTAWSHANDPATWLASRPADEDDPD